MSTQSVHQFAEKVALITNTDSPIGRAVAMQLALQGAFVIGLFNSENGCSGSVEPLLELGTLAHAVDADASNQSGAAAAAAEVDRIFGRLDLLVNCLKSEHESAFENDSESGFMDLVSNNLGAVHFLTRAVFSLMAERPKPKIVNVVSAPAIGDDPVFAATQASVMSLTKSLAAHLPANFRVNCVEVRGRADVASNAEVLNRESRSGVASDDVARAVLFLLSSESVAMNGQVVKLGCKPFFLGHGNASV